MMHGRWSVLSVLTRGFAESSGSDRDHDRGRLFGLLLVVLRGHVFENRRLVLIIRCRTCPGRGRNWLITITGMRMGGVAA